MNPLKFLLRLSVGAALVVFLLYEHEVRLRDVAHRMLDLPVSAILGAVLLDLGGQMISAYRWSRMLKIGGQEVDFRYVAPAYFSGMFFNICLPTSIGGDVVRVMGIRHHTQGKTPAFASVFMDRNIGLSALLALGLISALLVPTSIQVYFSTIQYPLDLPLWPLFLVLLCGYVVANLVLFSKRVFEWVDRSVLRFAPEKLRLQAEKLHAALQEYRRVWSTYAGPFVLSLLYQVSEVALVWVLARGFGLNLPFWVFGALVTLQAVAGLLPITINNIGIREGLFCAVLLGQAAGLGMSAAQMKDNALALSLTYFGVVVISGLIGGLVYLLAGLPRPSVVEFAEHSKLPASVPTLMDPSGPGS